MRYVPVFLNKNQIKFKKKIYRWIKIYLDILCIIRIISDSVTSCIFIDVFIINFNIPFLFFSCVIYNTFLIQFFNAILNVGKTWRWFTYFSWTLNSRNTWKMSSSDSSNFYVGICSFYKWLLFRKKYYKMRNSNLQRVREACWVSSWASAFCRSWKYCTSRLYGCGAVSTIAENYRDPTCSRHIR